MHEYTKYGMQIIFCDTPQLKPEQLCSLIIKIEISMYIWFNLQSFFIAISKNENINFSLKIFNLVLKPRAKLENVF
jgi:hypothetical protein